jgi:hypothetical protein
MNDIGTIPGMRCVHGLSVYAETAHHRILVDTGQNAATWENADALGIDITAVDTVILSHGHYDHTGGVMSFAEKNSAAAIYLNEKAGGDYWNILDGKTLAEGARYIGIDQAILRLPQTKLLRGDCVTEIGADPFIRCDRLEEIIVFPDHPYLEIRDGVLFSRPDRRLVSYPFALEAESYTVPEGTEIIGDFAFYENAVLKSVFLPDSLRTVGAAAFSECPVLEELAIPEGVTEIGPGALGWSERLKVTVIPGSAAERYCRENFLPYRTQE